MPTSYDLIVNKAWLIEAEVLGVSPNATMFPVATTKQFNLIIDRLIDWLNASKLPFTKADADRLESENHHAACTAVDVYLSNQS